MKNGKLIAVSAVATALGVVFLTLGAYISTLDLSALFMAALVIMLPLSKGSLKGAFLTYGATAILAFIIGMSRFYVPLLYVLFFGIHPIINYLQEKGGKKLWLLYPVKAVWFVGACFLMYYAFTMFVVEIEIAKQIMPVIITVIGLLFFIVYDLVMKRFQTLTERIVKRLGL